MCYNKNAMDILYENNNVLLKNPEAFDLVHIFDCGQCFRFNKLDDETYLGVAFNKALKISQHGDTVTLFDTSREDFMNIWYDFFDLSCDYEKIKHTLSSDKIMANAVKCGEGIRILKQDLWETIISFIISQSNNIPRIKGIIERLCRSFGDEIHYMGNTHYGFPSPERLAALSSEELSVIRAGFRDKYILGAARAICGGNPSLSYLQTLSADDAKKTLMSLKGIGNKVSDCILLFGLGHTDAFPVDVWIKRIMEYCYFDKEQSISTIQKLAREKFGDLGGYAQQYLFFYARENKLGT